MNWSNSLAGAKDEVGGGGGTALAPQTTFAVPHLSINVAEKLQVQACGKLLSPPHLLLLYGYTPRPDAPFMAAHQLRDNLCPSQKLEHQLCVDKQTEWQQTWCV